MTVEDLILIRDILDEAVTLRKKKELESHKRLCAAQNGNGEDIALAKKEHRIDVAAWMTADRVYRNFLKETNCRIQ